MNFAGKVAVVTGGGHGIGRAAALALGRAGAQLVVIDLDRGAAEAAAELVRTTGGAASAFSADVSQVADVRAYVAAAMAAHGRIDCFFNNAGIEGRVAPIHEADEDSFDSVIAVNLRGAFLGLRHVLPAMVAQRAGAVVNTSSVGGLKGAPNLAAYIASKHGVIGLTRSAAADMAPYGVRVNAVCPGPIDTRMIRSIEAQRAVLAPTAAAASSASFGAPEDVANLVLFLLSDLAANITGAAMPTDGGRTALPGSGLLTRP